MTVCTYIMQCLRDNNNIPCINVSGVYAWLLQHTARADSIMYMYVHCVSCCVFVVNACCVCVQYRSIPDSVCVLMVFSHTTTCQNPHTMNVISHDYFHLINALNSVYHFLQAQ